MDQIDKKGLRTNLLCFVEYEQGGGRTKAIVEYVFGEETAIELVESEKGR